MMRQLSKFACAVLGASVAMAAGMPLTAMAVDFDYEGVVVDGIKYGIVGTEAPFTAWVVETDMFDDDFEYEGEINIPASIEFEDGMEATVVGVDNSAFYGCKITTVTLPDCVETIGKQAFGLCSSLVSVKIGAGIKDIKSKAFYPDAKLTTMYVAAEEPPTLAVDALMNDPASMTLYVPAGSVEKYKDAAVWNTVGTILAEEQLVKVTEIVVTPSVATVAVMGTFQLSATVYPAEAQQKVAWTSSDVNVARVSGSGEIFGVRDGSCVITATASDGSGVTGECLVTVGSGKVLEVNMPLVSGFAGEKFTLVATVAPEDTDVEWSVADPDVASLVPDGLTAQLTLLSEGGTVVTVTADNGLSKEIEVVVKELVKLTAIDVAPTLIECEVGDRILFSEFEVTPVPENVSLFNPDFMIEDTSVVDYDPEDMDMETLECLAPGKTRLVWSQDGVEGYCTVVVAGEESLLTEIVLDPEELSGEYFPGDEIQVMAFPVPSDAVDFMPEWSSSDEELATVDADGLVTVVNPVGDVEITCASGIITATCKIHFVTSGVEVIDGARRYRVLSVEGVVVKESASQADLDSLAPGLYIVNGKKIIK